MGTEFFDGLGETLSRTAKEFGERAEQIYEAQKIRSRIAGEERIIDKIMTDIGNIIYKRHTSGEALDNELSVLCEEIHQHILKVKEYKGTAADIRGQKLCPSCGKTVDKAVSFCPYCGAPCPTAEPEEEEDDVVEENYEDNFPPEEPDSREEEDCGSETQEESCAEEQPDGEEAEQPVEKEPEQSVEDEK